MAADKTKKEWPQMNGMNADKTGKDTSGAAKDFGMWRRGLALSFA
jgi:hypothetical protein